MAWEQIPDGLRTLAGSLPLEDLDISVLLIASAISLDPRFERYYVVLNNDANARGPTVSTALRLSGRSMLDPFARSRLRPDAPLRTLGLIDVARLIAHDNSGAAPLVLDFRACGIDTPVIEILSSFFTIGVPAAILIDGRRSLGPWARRTATLELPSVVQRQAWWDHLAPGVDSALAQTSTHLNPDDIAATATGAESAALLRVSGQEHRSRIQTVKPALVLADVVLEERPAHQLAAVRDRVRFRTRILNEWGMRPGGARGRGVTALFAGPPGTGKSMSA